jgi:hypothetical protein
MIFFTLPNRSSGTKPWAYNRNEYQKQKKMFLRSRARPVSKADSLTATREPFV